MEDVISGLQNPQAATTSWTSDVWTKGHQVAIDGYRLFPCDPCRGLHATQMLEIKVRRRSKRCRTQRFSSDGGVTAGRIGVRPKWLQMTTQTSQCFW